MSDQGVTIEVGEEIKSLRATPKYVWTDYWTPSNPERYRVLYVHSKDAKGSLIYLKHPTRGNTLLAVPKRDVALNPKGMVEDQQYSDGDENALMVEASHTVKVVDYLKDLPPLPKRHGFDLSFTIV